MLVANSLLLRAINTPYMMINVCNICGSHARENKDYSLTACDAMKCGGVVRTVWGKTTVLNQLSILLIIYNFKTQQFIFLITKHFMTCYL
jgi:hypothetical protein